MARVSGPLMSVDASGKFGGSMVFGKWKGRNYTRQLVIPSNPKTAMQTGVRSMMKFLATAWAAVSAPNKATWADIAAAKAISTFNAYVGANLSRWQNNQGPTKDTPATEASAALTITAHSYTGSTGHATLSMTPSAATAIWGFAIFRDTVAITAQTWTKCIAVIPANGANAVVHDDTGLAAGTYHYRICTIQIDGKMGTLLADDTAVVT